MRYTIKTNRNFEVVETLTIEDAMTLANAKYPRVKDLEVFPSLWAQTHANVDLTLQEECDLLNAGFEDTSWKNDECASFQMPVEPYNLNNHVVVHLWVDARAEVERFQEGDGERFILQMYNPQTCEYFGDVYLPVDVLDAVQVANRMCNEYNESEHSKRVVLDVIETELVKHDNDALYIGDKHVEYVETEECIAISNMLHLLMEKLGLWNDGLSDEHSRDDDTDRLKRFAHIIKNQ